MVVKNEVEDVSGMIGGIREGGGKTGGREE